MKRLAMLTANKKGEITGATKLVLGVIAIVITMSLIPVLSHSVNEAVGLGDGNGTTANLSGANIILLSLTVLMFVAFIVILAVKRFIQ